MPALDISSVATAAFFATAVWAGLKVFAYRRRARDALAQMVLDLWRAGHDTVAIAEHLGITEAEAARLLDCSRPGRSDGKDAA